MTFNEIQTLIGSVGFPMACCIVMFMQNSKLQKTLSDLTITLEKMRIDLERGRA